MSTYKPILNKRERNKLLINYLIALTEFRITLDSRWYQVSQNAKPCMASDMLASMKHSN